MNGQDKPITMIESEELRGRIAGGEKIVVIDVRSKEEFSASHVEGAVNIPADQLTTDISNYSPDTLIVTVCNLGGARSCNAAETLRGLGYENAVPLQGGMRKWQQDLSDKNSLSGESS